MKWIALEWIKYRKNNLILIILSFYTLMLPVVLIVAKGIKEVPAPLPDPASLYTFPMVWDTLAYGGSWLNYYLIGFLSIYIITSEYTFGTAKQSIIQGATRTQYFLGKLGFLLSVIVCAFFLFLAVGIYFGWMYSTEELNGAFFGENNIILRFFLNGLGYGTLGIFFGILLRKTGLATLVYLAYTLFIEWGWRRLIHLNYFGEGASGFYPYKAHSDLCVFPLFRNAADTLHLDQVGIHYLSTQSAIIASIFYSALLIVISYFIFYRRDL